MGHCVYIGCNECTGVEVVQMGHLSTQYICHTILSFIWPLPSAHYISAIAYYPLSDRYLLHTLYLPYFTLLYLTATFCKLYIRHNSLSSIWPLPSTHNISAIPHYTLSDCYLRHTLNMPYHTNLYLTATFCTHYICHTSLTSTWLLPSAHTISAIPYYPVSDRYLLNRIYPPYFTILILTANFYIHYICHTSLSSIWLLPTTH